MADVVEIGLAFWLLLAPGENWAWVIVGGHESRDACEQARNARLDGDRLVVLRVDIAADVVTGPPLARAEVEVLRAKARRRFEGQAGLPAALMED